MGLKTRIENCVSGTEKSKQQLAEVLPEYGRLKERLSEVTKQHGDARRERESLESQSRSLSAELSDKIRQMEVRVNEVKYKKQIEITEISEKLEKEYDHRIQQTLAELRDFYENQMKTNRAEFSRKYET